MEKITNKTLLHITTLCILLIVPFLKFFSMNLEMFNLLNNYDNINPAIILYISIPVLIFIYIKDIIKKRKLDIYDYLFYVLVIIGVISIIFSIDKNLAIFGKSLRHEGFLSILSYYLLFINWKNNGTNDDIKKYVKLLIIIGIINGLYSILQVYTNFNFILRYYDNGRMASGLCGNPNFLGSLIVTILSIVSCKYLLNKEKKTKLIFILILLIITLINCQSTGPVLTYVITLIFLTIFINIKKHNILKKLYSLIAIITITYIGVYSLNMILDSSGIFKIKKEISTTALKETVQSGGNGRIRIWKNSLGIVKKYPIIGVGYDNFYLAYPNTKVEEDVNFIVTNNTVKRVNRGYLLYDNAHNIYLHTLVSTGILGLIPYLFLCLLTFIKGLKLKEKSGILLLGGFVAYSIQGFANISVIQVAPIYYLIIGLILSIKEEPNKTSNI